MRTRDQAPANDVTPEFTGAPPLRIRIPKLIDVLLVWDARQIEWLNQQPQVVRELDPTASVLHRVVERRVLVDLAFGGEVLPVFQSRHDSGRAARQKDLEQHLEDLRGLPGDERSEMTGYVSGAKDPSEIGVIVQQWCGRLFNSGYRSSPETYDAGTLIAGWPSAPPWRTMLDRASGRLAGAKQLLSTPAEGDMQCIHATAIGMHNLTRTLKKLRKAAGNPDKQAMSPDDIVRECLVTPPAVLRGVTGRMSVPFVKQPLTQRTLIVLLVSKAFGKSGDLDAAFMADQWSQCPAHEIVPEMLRAVWHGAQQGENDQSGLFATIHGARRLWHRAVS